MSTDRPLLQVLVVEDDPGDVALLESAFAEHSITSNLHHAGFLCEDRMARIM